MHEKRSLAEVNALSPTEFAHFFAGVLEHSPQYAGQVAGRRPFASLNALADAFAASVHLGTRPEHLALIRAHPDLAGKAALAGKLTAESASEQAGAGLDRLSPDEYAEFHRLNAAYHAKFEMPYVACVRANTKETLLAGAAERLSNTPEQEIERALAEIGQIARFRVLDLVREEAE